MGEFGGSTLFSISVIVSAHDGIQHEHLRCADSLVYSTIAS